VVNSGLDLRIESLSHFALGMSPVEAEANDKKKRKYDTDADNVPHPVAVVHVDDAHLNILLNVIRVQDPVADARSRLETSTDGVEDCLSL